MLRTSSTASPGSTRAWVRNMLSDYRVLDLADERGALCGQLLADLGAQVVRVEPPGGSPMRRGDGVAWGVYARNCSSVVLESDQHFHTLAADADLVIAPGAAQYST